MSPNKYRFFFTNDPATWELILSKEKTDLYSNIQDAMWQNGEEWRGRWTVARQGKVNRGFGRLAGGPWGGGGAPACFNLGDIQVNEPRQGGLARREQGRNMWEWSVERKQRHQVEVEEMVAMETLHKGVGWQYMERPMEDRVQVLG